MVNSGGFSPIQPVAWRFGGTFGLNAAALADRAQTIASVERADPQPDNVANLRAARNFATAALRQDPLVAPAWRALAIVERAMPGGSPDRAFDLLRVSSMVSRRDTGTSALLFEEFVQRGDLSAGFRQLDLAMRRSPQARQALLPVLVQGLEDADLRARLVLTMERHASWRGDFLRQLALTPPSDGALTAFVRQMPSMLIRSNRPDLYLLAAGLVQNGRLGSARALAQRLLVGGTLVTNGGFEQANAAPPLDWALQATADYDAVQGKYGGSIEGAQALYVRSRRDQPTEIARQIVFLAPGSVEISAIGGTLEGDRTASGSIVVACVARNSSVGAHLGVLQLPREVERANVKSRFGVPASGCPAQWLLVMIEGGSAGQEVAGWIDNVAMRQVDARSGGRTISGNQ